MTMYYDYLTASLVILHQVQGIGGFHLAGENDK